MKAATAKSVHGRLLDWYGREAADLPWRRSRDPYAVWLAEIMLQQTQVTTVIPYYQRFLQRFPTVASLAGAGLDEVLKLWEGLGYYSRARNLQRAARQVMQAHDGCLPRSAAQLQRLPGIGRYTAGAIASIAFNEAAPVLDGNVMRVFARLTDLDEDITRAATQRQLWALAQDWLHPTRPGDWNQALMELGRRVCRPRQPDCPRCPLQHNCLAHARGRQHELPRRRPRPQRPQHVDVVALLRNAQGEILIQRRPQEGLLGGLWTFPGGRARAEDASLEAALRRCLRETLALEVLPMAALEPVQHGFTHFQLTLHAWECALVHGPEVTESPEIAWVSPEDLTRYSFGGAERALIANWLTRPDRKKRDSAMIRADGARSASARVAFLHASQASTRR